MHRLHGLLTRLRRAFRQRATDAQLLAEMNDHLDRETARRIAQGEDPATARRRAAADFGSVDARTEEVRDHRFGAWVETTLRDLRFAVRSLLRTPGFTLVSLLTLAIGIGANTAMFSVVNTLLLHPAPYPEAERLVRVHRTTGETRNSPHALPNLRELAAEQQSFETLTAYCLWSFSMAEPGQPAQTLGGVIATADLFQTLGFQPFLGRAFTAEEQQPGRDRVAVLSHDFWLREFGGDPGIVGRAVRIDGESVTVIGVMPAAAAYPLYWGRVDLWRPLPEKDDWRQLRSVQWLNAIGRLRPGVSADTAHAELDTLAARLAAAHPESEAGAGLRLVPFEGSSLSEVGRNLTWLILGLAAFVLLIACANLGNLQLARQAARTHEFSIRTALGATRTHLVRQLLAQSLVLAFVGGGLGLALALLITRTVAPHLIGPAAAGTPFALDPRVAAFAAVVTLLTGLASGAVPAWLSARAGVGAGLRGGGRGTTGGRGHQRMRQALIIAQLACSVVLLAGSGYFIRGLQHATQRDLGWNPQNLLQGTITLPENRYPSPDDRRIFHERLLQELDTLPGVEHAALATALPLVDFIKPSPLVILDRPAPPPGHEPLAFHTVVSPDYFEAMQIRLLEGRWFSPDLRVDGTRPVVINASLARRFWPGESAVGRRLHDLGFPNDVREVIGVVADTETAGEFGAPPSRLQVYYPLIQDPWGYLTVLLRSPAPASLIEPLRQIVARIDPDLPVVNLQPVTETIAGARRHVEVANQLLGAFAAIGLALAAIGLYGVVSNLVTQRTSEFGIRLALGARPADIRHQVLRTGATLAGIGLVAGTAGALGVLRVLENLIPGLAVDDPFGLAAAIALLALTALAASWLPAARAARLDPLVALRSE